MIVKRHWKNVETRENPHKADARDLYQNEHASIVHLMLEPGQSLLPHKTPVDVAFYILQGKGVVRIGEERTEATEGELIESPKNITHCWSNESKENLRILVIKVPHPKGKTVIL